MSIEAMKQALQALEYNKLDVNKFNMLLSATNALRQAIEQAEKQEPVAWIHTKIEGVTVPHRPADLDKHPDRWEALYKTPPPCPTCEALARTVMMDQTAHDLYTTPQQREWVGLTDEEIALVCGECAASAYRHDDISYARAIEAKLKEKNS